jgi:hypothetical protein
MLATLEGDLARAERLAEEAFQIGRHTAGTFVDGVYGMQMFTIRREQGRLSEVAPIIKRFVDEHPEETIWRPGLALIASDLGFKDAAQRMLSQLAESGFAFPVDAKRSTTLAYLAEVCASVRNKAHAERLYELLLPYRDLTITVGQATACYGSAGRHLGLLADVTGEWDRAEDHFEAALVMNRDLEAWPWLAHTQSDFATMLLHRGRTADVAGAENLLSEASATANRLGMIALSAKLREHRN